MKLPRLSLVLYVGGMAVGLGAVLTFGVMEVTSTPGFCGSCHVMNPYYDSWSESKHSGIACVDCHIAPGAEAKLKKKFEAAAMVASYITGTYGTNPWTEVEDEACLKCHERRLLGSTEMFGNILFDHRPHLTELRRGKSLRCTSCHSQIVQGSHIAVTTSTCEICHFKGQAPNQGTARCTLCHQVPETIDPAAGVEFAHSDVRRFGMRCESCHVPARPTEGGVPRERCLVCHNQQERLDRYAETEEMHDNHVTDHKVECTNCHLEIQHVVPQHLETAQSECSACHDARHSPQRTLYAGLGGQGVTPSPDVMYRARVRCEGCHIDHSGDGTATAGEVACMSCHGPSYRKIYDMWQATLAQRTGALRREVDATAPHLDGSPPEAFSHATANLELVERGKGVHNFAYSLALLDASYRQLNTARTVGGLAELPVPWVTAPYASDCLSCHTGVETRRVEVFGKRFSHQPHVVGKGIRCQRCHTTHDERDAGAQVLRIDADGCLSCHHGDAANGAGGCLSCHGSVMQRTFPTEHGQFPHSFHVEDMEIECSSCHGELPDVSAKAERSICADCH